MNMGDKVIPVKVALRIRPLINREICDGCKECIEVVPNEPQVIIGNDSEKAFTYDYVFGQTSQQEDFYNNVVEPLVERFFNGYNATILAYGQTGSGKTYTMGTCAAMNAVDGSNEMDNGVIPKVIRELFQRVESMKEKCDFLIKVSFLEIHNEEVNDLLSQSSSEDKSIAIRENTSGEIKITGLQEVKVTSVQDMALCLEQGSSARATGATAMNTRSSRSHAIFTIMMEQREKTGVRDFKRAKFHLVDLAGSERAKKTQASGERLKEGININKGLLALGNVISALGDEQRKSHAHVPYRDSKLTRLLQDSLGGNSNTIMVACVSPADSNMEETHNTLKYADRARKIKNKPVVNRDPAAAELTKLRQQVQMLQLQLFEGQYIHQEGSVPNYDMQEVMERNKELESENEKLTSELHNAIDQTTSLHERIMLVELSRDKVKQKAEQLKEKILSRGLDLSFNLDDEKENTENGDIIKHIQKKVEEIDEEEKNLTVLVDSPSEVQEAESHTTDFDHHDIGDSTFAAQHALKKAELSKQLQELTKALSMKEELASKMGENDSRLTAMKKQHEMTVKELEHVIDKLEKEKSELNSALNASRSNPSSVKKEKERLRELEAQLNELRRKQIELKRLQRIKEQDDQKITKLNAEIKGMKQMKVKLMRQMKEEAEKFRHWKLNKDKEINQLKQQGRKRQFEYKKLESVHLKQQAVLRRKTEEAAAANRRLKAALSKQKEASEKRNYGIHTQNKQAENVLERMKSWLTHEVEVMVSSSEARNALKEIIEDRKTLSQEISALKMKLQEKLDEPSRKKVSLGGGDHSASDDTDVLDIRKEIQNLEIELEVRSSQIAELQQKIIDAEQGERTKYRWNNIHTMAEAKGGLKALFSWVVEAKLAQGQLIKEKEDCRRLSVETGSELEKIKNEHEKKLTSVMVQKEKEMLLSQKHYEEEVAKLLSELDKERELCEKQKNKLERMSEVEAENANLRQRLEEFSKVLLPEKNPRKKKTKNAEIEVVTLSDDEQESPAKTCNDEDYLPSTDCESDYFPTPVSKKKKTRTSTLGSSRPKNSRGSSINGCICKGNCSSKRCRCRKDALKCSNDCQCDKNICINKQEIAIVESLTNDCVPHQVVSEMKSPTSKSLATRSPLKNIAKNKTSLRKSNSKSPLSQKPLTSCSPKFLVPSKSVGLKQKPVRRRSTKHLSSNVKKLLNTSKSTILTPTKQFVGPMTTKRQASSLSKLNRGEKSPSSKNNENVRPERN